MSGMDVRPYAVGPEEEKILGRTRTALKNTIQKYFMANNVKDIERAELSDFIIGFERNEHAGFFGKPYTIGPAFDLKDSKCSLADYREWIVSLVAALGPKHDLSEQINKNVLTYVFDSMPTVLAEQSTIYTEAMTQLSAASALAKQTKSREQAMQRQLDTLRRQNQEKIDELNATIAALEGSIEEKDRAKALLERVAETQADSVKRLLSMGCLEQAITITIQTFRVLDASLEQLKQIDVAVQATQLRKNEIQTHLTLAGNSLDNMRNSEWVSQRVSESLATGATARVVSQIEAFTAREAQGQSSAVTQAQSEAVKHTLKRVIKKLEKYEKTVSGQWFKKLRKGYKKLRVVDSVIASLKELAQGLNTDGSNAYTTLQEANARVLRAKLDQDGAEREYYQDGKNYSQVVDKALSEIAQVIDKSVVSYAEQSASVLQPHLLEGINTSADLVQSIQASYTTAVSDINVTLRDETTAAVNSLEAASARFELLDRAITSAASVRGNFISAMEQAFEQRAEPRPSSEEEKLGMIENAMREVSTTSSRIHSKLRQSIREEAMPFAGQLLDQANSSGPAQADQIIVFGGSQ